MQNHTKEYRRTIFGSVERWKMFSLFIFLQQGPRSGKSGFMALPLGSREVESMQGGSQSSGGYIYMVRIAMIVVMMAGLMLHGNCKTIPRNENMIQSKECIYMKRGLYKIEYQHIGIQFFLLNFSTWAFLYYGSGGAGWFLLPILNEYYKDKLWYFDNKDRWVKECLN